ncbi:hypothetical protein TNCV_4461551 [Trichonephila clavipes]|nr:hypothetical protein TNCV_4461551 [Trichonephila clavipes]
MTKVVFSVLLSGMMAIGRTMESVRRGYGASSGWKVFEFFGLAESLEVALLHLMLGAVNIDSNWLPWGLGLGTKIEIKGENGNLVQLKKKEREVERAVSNNQVPSTSQQHLSVSQSPFNLEVTPDALNIDTERRKSEIEIGSKAYQL